jgi:protein-tyrosine phosphatase
MGLRARLLRTALAFAIAFSPAATVAAKTRPVVPAATVTRDLSRIHIDNFGQVSATYFRGGQPEGQDYVDLAAFGVRTLIDLQEADGDPNEARLAQANGMRYVRIPMSTHRPPTGEQLAQFFRIVNDPASQPVYVHCKGGRHRTGVMTAAYRMTFDGWNADRAFGEMKQYKFGADMLHPEFKKFVYGYDPRKVSAAAVAAVQQ